MMRPHSAVPIALTVALLLGCVTQSEVAMELPSSPSEDASHLLAIPASAAGEFDFDVVRDYLPDPNVNWIVTIEFDSPISREKINGQLDASWLETNGIPTVYGFSPNEERWTFVNAIDSPGTFSSLKIAWPLWDAIEKKPKAVQAEELERHTLAIQKTLSPLAESTTKADRSPEDALASAASLAVLVAMCDSDVTLKLVAPDGGRFPGHQVWDVMLCLGLDYGDGDLFHWINNSGFGDDLFFTVETSTPPGYFIPQRMASGEGDVRDLIFNFSVPRSADPLVVFQSMANAVEYTQKRLGGTVVNGSGEPFDRAGEQEKIGATVNRLKQAGFTPGESATCRVF